jgi:hypothetical protein
MIESLERDGERYKHLVEQFVGEVDGGPVLIE